MTAIAARIDVGPPAAPVAQVLRMLAAMRARGGDHPGHWADDAVSLAGSRHDWEARLAPSGPSPVAQRGPFAIAADATLYYRDDLCRTLAQKGISAPGDSAAELILAAYEAFGEGCLAHLEGDFAFVLWDRDRRLLLAARDFGGKRTLHYCRSGDTLAIASTIPGVLADDRVPRALNLGILAATAASLWQHTSDTCYRAVSELPAGCALTWTRDRGLTVSRFWQPRTHSTDGARTIDEAADELLALLMRATDERLAGDGPTALTLSGGWDSPAVFGAGQEVLRRSHSATRLIRPVSISYPQGDPGREDQLILDATGHWGVSSEWIDIDSIAMFQNVHARSRDREEPLVHPYEEWYRALARAARATGARVMLDGFGGDQLFQVSDVFLADLFKTGHWIRLLQQWESRKQRGVRAFLKSAVRPVLSDRMLRLLATLRRSGPPRHYLDRDPFRWFEYAFLKAHGVLERERAARPSFSHASPMLAEAHFYLLCPFFPRMAGRVSAFAVDEGVEVRSPLLDSRIVSFALARPWYEKADRAETKIVLRRAMRGLLPDRLLAPRPTRTGTTSGYFRRSLIGPGRPLVEEMLRDSVLASIGMINPKTLLRAWEHYLNSDNEALGIRIFHTLQAELWLREHEGMAKTRGAPPPA